MKTARHLCLRKIVVESRLAEYKVPTQSLQIDLLLAAALTFLDIVACSRFEQHHTRDEMHLVLNETSCTAVQLQLKHE